LAANAANEYWRDGFTVVLQDIYIGQSLSQVVDRLDISPLFVIVLAPRPEAIAYREQHRGKTGYGDWTIEQHYSDLERETPHIGLWIDTSDLSPEETVEQILLRLPESGVK
jgi:hypothetical protein